MLGLYNKFKTKQPGEYDTRNSLISNHKLKTSVPHDDLKL